MDDSSDDVIAAQAAMAQSKFAGMDKKSPTLAADKSKFDSADYYKAQQNLMKAAGLQEEEKKD